MRRSNERGSSSAAGTFERRFSRAMPEGLAGRLVLTLAGGAAMGKIAARFVSSDLVIWKDILNRCGRGSTLMAAG